MLRDKICSFTTHHIFFVQCSLSLKIDVSSQKSEIGNQLKKKKSRSRYKKNLHIMS